MPWKPSSVMEERLRFVARLLDGETPRLTNAPGAANHAALSGSLRGWFGPFN
jgi:hypothetical protein